MENSTKESTSKPDTAREKLTKAARLLFSQRGYKGTSTRELAAQAGVTERALFRHFPSKPLIFEAAIVEPFNAAIEEYVGRWEMRQHGVANAESEATELFSDLFDILSDNRGLVKALMAAHDFDANVINSGPASRPRFSVLLDRLQMVMEVEAKARGWALDSEVTIRLLFGMLLSATVYDDWLFNSPSPKRERLLSELVSISVYGMAGRPDRA